MAPPTLWAPGPPPAAPSSKVRSHNAAHTIAVRIFLKNTALPLKHIHLHALM